MIFAISKRKAGKKPSKVVVLVGTRNGGFIIDSDLYGLFLEETKRELGGSGSLKAAQV
jgi:hypothetical protein